MILDIDTVAKNAKEASLKLQNLSTDIKNLALKSIVDTLKEYSSEILANNCEDLAKIENSPDFGGISKATFNRLILNDNKMETMLKGVEDLINIDDPINKCLLARELDNGLNLYKVSCPIGVLGVIFEARPDVITQIAALAIKSSNAVILKGGKEATNTNKKILYYINMALDKVPEFPKNAINLIFSHEDVDKMLKMNEYIDLIIPRGGNKLVKYIKSNTSIPVLGHADGICHIYIDDSADLEMAKNIVIDAKTQYPSACNAVETLLINKNFAKKEDLVNAIKNAGVQLINNPDRWDFEYSDTILAYKIVNNINDAISHINIYGSGHTDAIVTDNINNAEKFMNEVDSSGVYYNASTRFSDGYRYGFGAEVGISTNKTHARGPVGLEGLTIYKYKLYGNGQIVKDYAEGTKNFTHNDIAF